METNLNAILTLVDKLGHDWAAISTILNENPEKIRSVYRRHMSKISVPEQPIFLDKKSVVKQNWREIADRASTSAKIASESDPYQRGCTVKIDTELPIGVVYTGDWHLGGSAVDYESWLAMIDLVLQNNFLYIIDLGDDRENMRTFKNLSLVLSQVISPKDQAALIKGLVDELTSKNKILAKIGGNHDLDFDERILGESFQEYLLENIKAPIFKNKGVLNLVVGDETYTNLLFHKGSSSSTRPTHGAVKEHKTFMPAEITAGAHDHAPGFEIMWGYNTTGKSGENYFIKVGTFSDSDYGWKYFYNSGPPITPVVVYFPKSHKKIPFMHIEDAVKYLGGYYGECDS